MDLIAILLALWFTRMIPADAGWRVPALFRGYADGLARRITDDDRWQSPLSVAALMVPPVLAVGVLQLILGGRLAGLLYLVFAVLVLVACLPATRSDQLLGKAAGAWQRDDVDGVREALTELDPELTADVDEDALRERMVATASRRGAELLFGVFFWFVILGPFGAVLWRMAGLGRALTTGDRSDSMARAPLATWHHWLAWIPARLTVLGYAVMGNFNDAMSTWRVIADTGRGTDALLEMAGVAAVGPKPGEERDDGIEWLREARRLLRRALLLWLAVIALMTIAGLL